MRNISHALITKVIVFLIAIACLTGTAKAIMGMELNHVYLSNINEDNYFESQVFADESYSVISSLAQLIGQYKSEEYILSGKALTNEDITAIEEELYNNFQYSSKYNPNLTELEYRRIYQEEYADELNSKKEESMRQQVRVFYRLLNTLEASEGIVYYASDGKHIFSNSELNKKEQFTSFGAYMLVDDYQQKLYPKEVGKSKYVDYVTQEVEQLNPQTDVIYVAFEELSYSKKCRNGKKIKRLPNVY
ncbi:histidine kinase OS=Lysinibacillus sphaericus OX=1421 GN=tcrY PE=4 SV=1 [Lysinibacillus sphaericus]